MSESGGRLDPVNSLRASSAINSPEILESIFDAMPLAFYLRISKLGTIPLVRSDLILKENLKCL